MYCELLFISIVVSSSVHITQASLAMSRRSPLSHSLSCQAIGWVEMEMSQADAAGLLNVYRSVA